MRALLLSAMVLAIGLASSPADAEDRRVVILPIMVHSADGDTAYVSDGLSAMLAARLEQVGGINVVRVKGEPDNAIRLPEALEEARRRDAQYVLFGAFTQFGEGASLDLACAEVGIVEGTEQDAPRRVFIQSGTMAEIIPKLDELVGKIGQYVNSGVRASNPDELASSNGSSEDLNLDELRERVEALEQAVYEPDLVSEDASASTTEVIDEPAPES